MASPSRDASLRRDRHRRPGPIRPRLAQTARQRRPVLLHGPRRKPVSQDHRRVVGARREPGRRVRIEPPAKVRPPQVLRPAPGLAANRDGAEPLQVSGQLLNVQGMVDRVARLGMGQLELEHPPGRQRVARPAERDPRRGPAPQPLPGVVLSHATALASRRAAPLPASRGRSRPAASRTPIRSSHASNSGAGRRPRTDAHVERIVERRALVVQHHVVRARHAHDVVHAGHAEQRQQRVHVVLVGLGVVGVADVAAHRQAEQLAAEVVLQPGADDLLAVVEVLGADEADDGVDQQRPVAPRDRVGARLAWSAGRRRGAPRPRARCPGRSRNT